MPRVDQGVDCRVGLGMGERGGPSEVQDSRGMRAWPRASGKAQKSCSSPSSRVLRAHVHRQLVPPCSSCLSSAPADSRCHSVAAPCADLNDFG